MIFGTFKMIFSKCLNVKEYAFGERESPIQYSSDSHASTPTRGI